jgi:hypothetical protein
MLKAYIDDILKRQPELAAAAPVIEKEILHHDILHVFIEQGALQPLTFIGGTSLRLCYNSSRLSEDLDFNGGHDFKPKHLNGLEKDIKAFIEKKHETSVTVNKPNEEKQGKPSSWKISIEKEPNRPDIPRQKITIDVCSIPSFDIEKRPLINHYGLDVSTEGLLIPVQSLSETLADKFIALAYRARRIKPRDIWDIVWLHQQNAQLDKNLLMQKLDARNKTHNDFESALRQQVDKLVNDQQVHDDFTSEMSRFISSTLKERTLDNPDYWPYLQMQIQELAKQFTQPKNYQDDFFDMSNDND